MTWPSATGKYLVRHDIGVRVADALRHVARHEIVHRLVRQYADSGIDQGGVDITAFAGLLALRQRRQNADDRIDAGEDVGNRNADTGRLAVRHAGQIHDAAHALRHQVVAGAFGVGAVLAEAGDRAVDQARALGRETFVVEAELGEAADLEVLDQHVRARGQLAHDAPALIALEVHLDRALAAVGRMKIGRANMVAVGAFDEGRAPAAGIVARALALDLDDVGAEIGEHLSRPRDRPGCGQVRGRGGRQAVSTWNLP